MMSEDSYEKTCDRCSKEALGVLGDETLCEDCLHESSACCAGEEM
jgi:hypothetical protein